MAEPSAPKDDGFGLSDSDSSENSNNKNGTHNNSAATGGALNKQRIAVGECIRALQAEAADKSQSDYKEFRSYDPVPPVSVAISSIDATAHARLGFRSLLRQCLRDIEVSAVAMHNLSKTPGSLPAANRLHLELPEVGGIQCSVSLDLRYRVLPFALDRPVTTAAFFSDLKELSSSKLEIVQTVPLSCVNASLLYGVPYDVRAGADDFEGYQEMRTVVRSLFQHMQVSEVAMLLRIAEPNDVTAKVETIFHNSNRRQLFILMADEGPNMSTGVLFRYASADELLLEAEKSIGDNESTSLPDEVAEEYDNYMGAAFQQFDCMAVNPLYLDAMEEKSPDSATHSPIHVTFDAASKNRKSGHHGFDELSVNFESDSDNDCNRFDYG